MTRPISPDEYRIQSLERQLADTRHLAPPRADASRVVAITRPEDWQQGGGFAAGAAVTDYTAMRHAAFWACVRLRGGAIGSLPLPVYQMAGDVPVEARGSALWKVLHDSPNADQSPVDYWEFASLSLDLRGNHYARKFRDSRGQLIALEPIPPDVMHVYRQADGRRGYRWSWLGQAYDLDEEEVFHVRGFGGGPLGGLSTLQFARRSLGVALAADEAAGSMFANGVRPSGVLKFKNFLTPDQRSVARGEVTDQFTGAAHTGRPFVLEGGADWQSISINADDAQLLESRGWSVEDVCRWFLVPPIMVGHSDKQTSWGSGVEQVLTAFHKFSLAPTLRRIRQAIWKQLLTPAERAAGFYADFNTDALLSATTKDRNDAYESSLKNKWRTINEVRRKENLPPVPWGDAPWGQQQDVQLNADGTLTTEPSDGDEE